jgi:tetratricopeptide (TPR) repeat protein
MISAARRHRGWALVSVLAPALVLPSAGAASPLDDAVSLCRQADDAPYVEKRDVLERGIAAAEAAIAADEDDADAHFALFCNLGKRMRLDGVSLASLIGLRRLRHEIDRTLELAPANADALVGKAALLYYTPRLLGGDPAEGERLLHEALGIAPDYVEARLAIARLLRARGNRTAARAAARQALEDATHKAKPAVASEAMRLLDDLEN